MKDWPKIPEIEVIFIPQGDGSLKADVIEIDLGLLGKWKLPGMAIVDPKTLGDPEFLKECMEDSRREVQTAFGRIILKAAALILVKRGQGISPMLGWYETALEEKGIARGIESVLAEEVESG